MAQWGDPDKKEGHPASAVVSLRQTAARSFVRSPGKKRGVHAKLSDLTAEADLRQMFGGQPGSKIS